MIESAIGYLLAVAAVAAFFGIWEKRSNTPLFEYLPAVVLIYGGAMLLAQTGILGKNGAIDTAYATAKANLLPAMLFLMMLRVDLRHFLKLGRSLLIAYAGAVLSLAAAFAAIFWIFGFSHEEAGLFAALCGSWMGGTANMLAIGGAMDVGESMMGFAFVTDAVNYTLWVVTLLALVRAAPAFNRWSGAGDFEQNISNLGCACSVGPARYWQLILLSLLVAWSCQWAAPLLGGLGTTTWLVLLATAVGLGASYTPLSRVGGSSEIAATMLLLLVALIGSRADFSGWEAVPLYLLAGFAILVLHALIMLSAAKLFRLDLFSIGVASLANIGGVASAPILAAAYDRSLVGVAVLMAVMGYLVGTFGGLAVGHLLQTIAP
jgi:uncharacterized membrane protein